MSTSIIIIFFFLYIIIFVIPNTPRCLCATPVWRTPAVCFGSFRIERERLFYFFFFFFYQHSCRILNKLQCVNRHLPALSRHNIIIIMIIYDVGTKIVHGRSKMFNIIGGTRRSEKPVCACVYYALSVYILNISFFFFLNLSGQIIIGWVR